VERGPTPAQDLEQREQVCLAHVPVAIAVKAAERELQPVGARRGGVEGAHDFHEAFQRHLRSTVVLPVARDGREDALRDRVETQLRSQQKIALSHDAVGGGGFQRLM
jgi:hypothetical protein